MRNRLPIALSAAALVVALLGAVPVAQSHGVFHALFAHRAGAVDGKSAVGGGATLNRAAGKLVATKARGTDRGKFFKKFIPKVDSAFNADNATNAANADKLDGLDANQLTRAISGVAAVNTGVNSSATADVLTATAPTAGGLLVNLSFSCASFSGTVDTRWDINARVDAVNRGTSMVLWFRGDEGDLGDSASTTVFVPVAVGNHTVGYTASRSSGDNSLDCNIAASSLFVPFSNAGTTPARAPVSAGRGLGNGS
jgi:hypothetical protein